MAIAKVRDLTSHSNLTSQAATPVSLSGVLSGPTVVDNYLIARIAVDNTGSAGARPGLTVTDTKGNTWAVTTGALIDPGNASAGVTEYIAYSKVVTPLTTADTITFTWGAGSPAAKAIVIEEWSGIHLTAPVAVAAVQASGSSGTPSASRTTTSLGELVYGAIGVEGRTQSITADADTTGGAWVALTTVQTADLVTDLNNVTIYGAYKIPTAAGPQTLNPTITSRDWAEELIVFAAAPVAVAGAQATGSDTGTAGAVRATRTGAQAAETDAALAGGPQVPVAGGQAAEADAAHAGTLRTTTPGSAAGDAATAQPGASRVTAAGQTAGDTGSATGGAAIARTAGQAAAESSTATTGSTNAATTGDLAAETDAGLTGGATTTTTGSTAQETTSSAAGATTTATSGAAATDASTTLAGTIDAEEAGGVIDGDLAAETTAALTGTIRTTVVGSTGAETDAAPAGDTAIFRTIVVTWGAATRNPRVTTPTVTGRRTSTPTVVDVAGTATRLQRTLAPTR